MTRLHALFVASAVLLVVTSSRPALAQAPETADAALERGVALRRAGDDEGALAAFTAAWEAGHAPRARAQMGLAEQALGRWVDAHRHLEEALAAVDDPWIARNRAPLDAALATVRTHTGKLELRGGVDGAHVRVNGQDAGTLPLISPIIVEAGSVVVEVSAAGYHALTRTFDVAAGGLARETLTLVPLSPTEATQQLVDDGTPSVAPTDALGRPAGAAHAAGPHVPPPPRTDDGAVPRAVAIVGFSLAAVTLGLSFAALATYYDNAAVWNDDARCLPPPGAPPGATRLTTCMSQYATLTTALDWATAGFVTTGVLVATGVVALVLALTAGHGTPPPPTARLACGPTLGTVGVSCAGAW